MGASQSADADGASLADAKTVLPSTGPLVLAVNGERREVPNPDPMATLSDYLRSTGVTGVKIGCGEGGCGACTVVIAEWSAKAQKPVYRSVNTCLVPLCSCDGVAVTTTEGLRCSNRFHPLQESLAAKNGAQCGFCSPGMVMSMFGKLSSTPGELCPSAAEIEGALDGNLCRCTGYRGILEAFREFAGTEKASVAGEKFAPFPEFLKGRERVLGPFSGSGKVWVAPDSVAKLYETLQAASPDKMVSMVAGHTCRGIYKDDHLTDVYVSIGNIPELVAIEQTECGITFGAAVTLTTFIETLQAAAAVEGKGGLEALPVLVEHAKRISGHGIRNWGTLGGNLTMTKNKGFQSDLATILTGVDAKVKVVEAADRMRDLPLDEFYSASYKMPPHGLLKSVYVPFLEEGEVFRSFKVAVRPQNSHAIVNAAFRVKMDGTTISAARLVFGAFGSRGDTPGPSEPEVNQGGTPGGPLRAPLTEKAVAGLDAGTGLKKALEALPQERWWPEDKYERHLALSFLLKLFRVLKGPGDDEPFLRVAQTSDRPASKATQHVDWATKEQAPIGKASPKLTSKLHAAGDIRYTNDLPEPKDCLYAAYVVVPRVKAVVVDIDYEAALKMPGVEGVITADDIPGENASEGLLPVALQAKLLLAKGDTSQYAGQPCMMIVADSTKHAELAAKKVVLKLEASAEKPLLTAQACMQTLELNPEQAAGSSPVANMAHQVTRGDAEAALSAAPHTVQGDIFCNSQRHFSMEPLASLVVPGDDGTVNVWMTTQVPSWAHEALRRVTALPKHKILLNIPAVGGGFGGKLFRAMHVGSAAAVGAMKFKRAVRFHLNRNVDVVMSGGRQAMSIHYEAGFDDAGRLAAVRVRNYADAGHPDACGGFVSMVVNQNMEQIYGIPNLDLKVWGCRTDKTPTTAVRGPGEPQASFIMESILEHVAMELGKDPHEVREANIFTDPSAREKVAADPTSAEVEQYSAQVKFGEGKDAGGVPFKNFPALGIWEMLKQKADYEGKARAVAEFNSRHTWRKQGLAMTPVKYSVGIRPQNALVCLYDDGSVLITVDGSEIGQGLHTKVIQFASHHLSQIVPGCEVPVEHIRVGPNGTDKVACGSFTGGSTTTEGCCEAVRYAIQKLGEELEPFKAKLTGQELTYTALVKTASLAGAEMQASGRCHNDLSYHVFGAAASRVEVDVLTGETTILSTNMLYDCGKSLNPTIDCGQAEGAFLMGVGFFLRENLLQSAETGQVLSDGTWEYKIPCAQDVPLELSVEFFPRAFEVGIASSKASGEPPLVLASSVFCAVRRAVAEARKQFGKTGHFRMDAPSTPRDIALAIGAGPEDWSLVA